MNAYSRGFAPRPAALPGTIGLVASLGLAFVLAWLPGVGAQIRDALAFDGTLAQPWTLLTYPFAMSGDGTGLFFFLFLLLWMWMIGQSLEPSLGTRGYLLTFGAFTIAGGLAMLIGALLVNREIAMFGPSIPVAAMTVLWCARNLEQTVMFMFVLPLRAKWLALITVLLVVFGFGTGNPFLGVLAAVPCGLAWFYGARMGAAAGAGTTFRPKPDRQQARREREQFNLYIDDVRAREKEREERERLRKLFESSLDDDDPR